MGCIYRKKWRDRKTGELVEGKTLWIKYYRNGKPYDESTHSAREAAAKKLLKLREGEISKGELPGIVYEKITFDEIAKDYLTDYEVNKKKSVKKAGQYIDHLQEDFSGARVIDISTARISEYVKKKIEEGKANATINRDLSALKRMFTLAKRSNKVRDVPYVPMLQENNVRKGFFEFENFLAIRDALPEYLKPVVTFAYHTGWRKGEILSLTWDRVDMKLGTIRLDPGETKNKEARTYYMTPELLNEMRRVHSQRRLGCPYVFHHEGQPIRKFEKAWRTACIDAGFWKPVKDKDGEDVIVKRRGKQEVKKAHTKLFHDFRRTAARNMVRSGIHERVAMTITGHKTRSVFDRYNIVSDLDLKEAREKQQAFFEFQSKTVTVSVTVKEPASVTH
jgi:integrase